MPLHETTELETFAAELATMANQLDDSAAKAFELQQITENEYNDVAEQAAALRLKSQELLVAVAADIIQNIQDAQEQLTECTEHANKQIKQINDLQKTMATVALMLSLAGAVVQGNAKDVVENIKQLKAIK